VLVVVVNVTVRQDAVERFERAIMENARCAREREPGCLRFDVCQSLDTPGAWLFYEVYRDDLAFAEHRASPHFAAYQRVADEVLLTKALTRYSLKEGTPARA
jgi:quinol monooxygenase YgiN